MKKILLIILSIMLVILSCKSPSTPIVKSETFVSAKVVNGTSYLAIAFDNTGGFDLYYSSDINGTPLSDNKKNKVTGEDIKGDDPNYTFQTGVIAGSLQFVSDTLIKVTVTFNDETVTLKDVLCYKTGNTI
ncbi:hypothetical protein R4L22_08845 [Brachyspira pilosicoli]|uniref:hypothetical protein n=1 Tax=Brachyspira pilosicoli TaxID=52584 RepID=UPI0012F4C60B|nr:hypothetical protein [Brachyspira pilosicoli]